MTSLIIMFRGIRWFNWPLPWRRIFIRYYDKTSYQNYWNQYMCGSGAWMIQMKSTNFVSNSSFKKFIWKFHETWRKCPLKQKTICIFRFVFIALVVAEICRDMFAINSSIGFRSLQCHPTICAMHIKQIIHGLLASRRRHLSRAWGWHWFFNTLRPRQNSRHFPDDIFKCIFMNENCCTLIKISLICVFQCPVNNIPALVQIMAWCRSGDKLLSEPMMA